MVSHLVLWCTYQGRETGIKALLFRLEISPCAAAETENAELTTQVSTNRRKTKCNWKTNRVPSYESHDRVVKQMGENLYYGIGTQRLVSKFNDLV